MRNEAEFRRLVALRLRTFGSELVRQGILSSNSFRDRCELVGPDMTVRECFWTNFDGLRGEIDIYMPAVRVAIEAKVYGAYRINYEEAIGQALRDRTSILVDFALIAVPTTFVPVWVRAVCLENGLGVIGLRERSRTLPESRRVFTICPPRRGISVDSAQPSA